MLKTTHLSLLSLLLIMIVACTPDLLHEATYHGTVYESETGEPFPNLIVKVTDGKNIHTQTKTDINGEFTIAVNVDEINGDYYILVGDDTCEKEIVPFPGFADGVIELGIITVEGPCLPIVETSDVYSADANTLRCGGKVLDNGRIPVLDRGICYSQMTYPTIDDNKYSEGKGVGDFSCVIRNLNIGSSYYFRAYATNEKGTAYGAQYQVTMQDGLPIVTLLRVDDITSNSAIAYGCVKGNGGYDIVQRGFCWATHQLPTIQDNVVTDTGKLGEYALAIASLQRQETYYVRSFATNEIGTRYSSEQLVFITTDGCPIVLTGQVSSTATSIDVEGLINDDGGYPITECGVCYSTTNDFPSISGTKVISEDATGSFYVTIPDLSPSAKYYVRAYAINANGVSYGKVNNVYTKDGKPEVILEKITNVHATYAEAFIKIDDSHGVDLLSCGVCWSENPNPTISSSKEETVNPTINTSYNYRLSNLSPETKYYVHAYATSNIGTSYSEQYTFVTSSGKPVVTTAESFTGSQNYLIISGFAYSDAPIIRQGICWSVNPNPSIADGIVEASSNQSQFSCRIEGLEPGTSYYCRAFAENEYGIAYGESCEFATDYAPGKLTGYVYDQDGYPIANAQISSYNVSGYRATTDKNGYYSIDLGSISGRYKFSVSADGYAGKIQEIKINKGAVHYQDFTLTLTDSYAVDWGNGMWSYTGQPWEMYFECTSVSMMGTTTTRNVRIKNYRSVSVSWSISNIPSSGIKFSRTSGTIPAGGEVAITVTFIYPSKSSYQVLFNGYNAYVWNWSGTYGGCAIGNGSYIEAKAACCWQNPILMVDGNSEEFSLIFNQFVIYKGNTLVYN